MYCNLHTAITLCEQSVMIQSLSLHEQREKVEKNYYQHRHPCFEMHYISAGESQAFCENKTYALNLGTALIIPPGTYHDLADSDKGSTRISISFDINKPSTLNRESKADMFSRVFYRTDPICVDLQNTEAAQILEKMETMLSGALDGVYQKDKLLALCGSLLLEIADLVTTDKHVSATQFITGAAPDAAFKIDGFLGRNFMYNNAMPRMAEELHISTRQLHRMIQKNYHTNYRQRLSETRIKIAMDMLSNTTMPIYRIGEILGYSNTSNFSIFVKRHTGKTPSQIRKGSNTGKR